MADYTINWSNGTLKSPFTLPENTINTSTTSLTLTGKGTTDWGEPLQENQIHLLENFASDVAPSNATIGQLWYDSGTTTLKMCESVGPVVWRPVYTLSGIARPTAPSSPGTGQFWYNTTTNILYHWSGTEWIPIYTSTSLTAAVAPSSPKVGQLWYSSSTNAMSIWNGSAWVVIFTGNSISSGTAPVSPVRGQLWYDTSVGTGVLKIYDTTNTFVPIASATLSIGGDLDMNTHKIINMAPATTSTGAVNKSQLDNKNRFHQFVRYVNTTTTQVIAPGAGTEIIWTHSSSATIDVNSPTNIFSAYAAGGIQVSASAPAGVYVRITAQLGVMITSAQNQFLRILITKDPLPTYTRIAYNTVFSQSLMIQGLSGYNPTGTGWCSLSTPPFLAAPGDVYKMVVISEFANSSMTLHDTTGGVGGVRQFADCFFGIETVNWS